MLKKIIQKIKIIFNAFKLYEENIQLKKVNNQQLFQIECLKSMLPSINIDMTKCNILKLAKSEGSSIIGKVNYININELYYTLDITSLNQDLNIDDKIKLITLSFKLIENLGCYCPSIKITYGENYGCVYLTHIESTVKISLNEDGFEVYYLKDDIIRKIRKAIFNKIVNQ